MTYRVLLLPLLLLFLISACTPQPPTSVVPTASPTTTRGLTPTRDTQTTVTPRQAATPAPVVSIGPIEPINVMIPASFTGSAADTFAVFEPSPVQDAAQVAAPAIAPDLRNVELTVLLTPEQRERIAQNGFVVSPGETREFYELYERARYDGIPAFVTSDSLLHVYHLLFDKVLRHAETEFFIPMLTRLDLALLEASVAQYEELVGTPWAEAARRNAAYFAVAVKIINPNWPIPEGLRDMAEPDLASIAAHDQIGPSAIFPAYSRGEDWSQYVPRGHYTKSAELERYFVAMMWHGRMTFRATDVTETQQAALLTLAFQQATVAGSGEPAEVVWSGIYAPTVFFVGRSDDLTPQEYSLALESAYGEVTTAQELLDDANFARFRTAVNELRPPQILGMVIDPDAPDVEAETQGLRLMGQRFVPDAFVFGKLIADEVPRRMLPKSLDFFAAIGSERALQHLAELGETEYPNYQQNMDELRATFAAYDEDIWMQNLYWSWIYSLRPLLAPVEAGYPQFMQSVAWQDKQLTTALGSWTELKRDTILYAKQVYAEGGAGTAPVPAPPKGYVEPVPQLYARVAALAQMTIDGLARRGLLSEPDERALAQMVDIARRLQTLAEKELRGEPLTEEEYDLIRFYGRELEGLTFAAADEDGGTVDEAAVIADIATDPNGGRVLENGVGRVFDIYVVAPIEGRLVLTRGGVFAHYEFVQPLSNRLTDEAWREMLAAGDAPPLADWTGSFMVAERMEQTLAETIRTFNKNLAEAFWYRDVSYVEAYLSGAELEDTRAYINQLQAQNQFVGAQQLNLHFLSFDFQDANHATVAVRERWTDTLYQGDYFQPEPPVVGVRPPYETVVTYTLERQSDQNWQITRIVLNPDPPAWEQP